MELQQKILIFLLLLNIFINLLQKNWNRIGAELEFYDNHEHRIVNVIVVKLLILIVQK